MELLHILAICVVLYIWYSSTNKVENFFWGWGAPAPAQVVGTVGGNIIGLSYEPVNDRAARFFSKVQKLLHASKVPACMIAKMLWNENKGKIHYEITKTYNRNPNLKCPPKEELWQNFSRAYNDTSSKNVMFEMDVQVNDIYGVLRELFDEIFDTACANGSMMNPDQIIATFEDVFNSICPRNIEPAKFRPGFGPGAQQVVVQDVGIAKSQDISQIAGGNVTLGNVTTSQNIAQAQNINIAQIAPANNTNWVDYQGRDIPGFDRAHKSNVPNIETCKQLCADNGTCTNMAYVPGSRDCFLKSPNKTPGIANMIKTPDGFYTIGDSDFPGFDLPGMPLPAQDIGVCGDYLWKDKRADFAAYSFDQKNCWLKRLNDTPGVNHSFNKQFKMAPGEAIAQKQQTSDMDMCKQNPSEWYLKVHKDVAAAGMNPVEHYMKHGRSEGRANCFGVPARFVRVKGAGGWLNLNEIMVFSGGQNVAAGKPFTASSDAGGDNRLSKLFDNDINTMGHTGQANQEWIMVDLGSEFLVDRILVVNRKDCCQGRIIGARVELLQPGGFGLKKVVWTSEPFKGKGGGITPLDHPDTSGWAFYGMHPGQGTEVRGNDK